MPQREGKCRNFGLCTIADSREAITLSEGVAFACRECGKMLAEVDSGGGAAKGWGKSKIALAGLAVMLLAGGGYVLLTEEEEPKKNEPKKEMTDPEKKPPQEKQKEIEDQQAMERQIKEQQALLQQQKDQLRQEQEKLNQAKALEERLERPNPGFDGRKKPDETAVVAEKLGFPYTGPSSGSIVWEGSINGTELITIDNGSSNKGSIISGKLPGVPVLIQPRNPKKVGIAGAPGPDNKYQRVTLRVQGNGQTKAELSWSLP